MSTLTEREKQRDLVMERGKALYNYELKDTLEREHRGEVVAIQPDSGEYAIGDDTTAAVKAIRARDIRGFLFVRRIGPPTEEDRRFAARVSVSEIKTR